MGGDNMFNKNVVLYGFMIACIVALLFWFVIPAFATNNNVTICHKNNGNGWSQISVDPSAINGIGNGDHNSIHHQNGQDIIPPGYWDITGRNWNTQGQAIYNNNCNIPVTPTPTPTSTPTPMPSTTPTPTTTPEPTPTVEVKESVKGDDRGDYRKEEAKAPAPVVCTVPFEVSRVWYEGGKFFWANDTQGIQKFSIVYGKTKNNLEYGIDNIPASSRSIEINGRNGWNQTWWAVYTWKDNCHNVSEVIDP